MVMLNHYVKAEHFSDRYICIWIFLLYSEYSEEFWSAGQPNQRLEIHKITRMIGFVENEVSMQMVEIIWDEVSSSLPLIALRNFVRRISAVFGIPNGYS